MTSGDFWCITGALFGSSILHMSANQTQVYLQKVRWAPPDGLEAGIRVWRDGGEEGARSDEAYIPWHELKTELEHTLLPQLFANPQGYGVRITDYQGKKDWLVEVINSTDEPYCQLWFGGNPDQAWTFDGAVRVGDPHTAPYVWQGYRRYSDGSYVRFYARTPTIDELGRR